MHDGYEYKKNTLGTMEIIAENSSDSTVGAVCFLYKVDMIYK